MRTSVPLSFEQYHATVGALGMMWTEENTRFGVPFMGWA